MTKWSCKAGFEPRQLPYLKELTENWGKTKESEKLKLEEVRIDMFDRVPVLRLSKAYTPKGEGQIMKLHIRITDSRLRDGLFSIFQLAGLERKSGMAPRGALERLIQGKLDTIKKKE